MPKNENEGFAHENEKIVGQAFLVSLHLRQLTTLTGLMIFMGNGGLLMPNLPAARF